MTKMIPRLLGVFFLGTIAVVLVSWFSMSAITAGTFSLLFIAFTSACTYLIVGVVVGQFWPKGALSGGICLASPIIVFTFLSVLFSGFGERFVDRDLPVLIISVISGVFGCFAGKRLANVRVNV